MLQLVSYHHHCYTIWTVLTYNCEIQTCDQRPVVTTSSESSPRFSCIRQYYLICSCLNPFNTNML
uniref:Uncharacterized protein n=1 Tax=Octopus bimaculoides TaxID=37653 RepID=A0A0L8IFN1_OCTBM